MKKKTIAKIQLIIGIIILIAGIVGLVYSISWANNVTEMYAQYVDQEEIKQGCPECSDTEITTLASGAINIKLNTLSIPISAITSLGAISILSILLSLLFITQGLINLPREIR